MVVNILSCQRGALHMGGGYHGGYAILYCHPGHGQGGVLIGWTIVHSWQDVAVDVNHDAP
jgi:hypothetical protein